MRAVQVTEFGGPEVLKPVELPDPEPGPGQQLIEVSRIGVNYADTDQKALIYVRLSSYAGESDTTTSPARQEEECRQWCAVNGYEVVEVIKDLDVSGSDKGLRLDRPGLLQVRQTIAGEPTLKIVEDFNAKGVASPEGKGWGSDTIRKLLRRRSSGGCRSTGARSCAASTGCRSGLTRRDRDRRGMEGAPDGPGGTGGPGGWRNKPPSLLKGLAVCDLCGRALHSVDQEGKSGFFKCSRHGRGSRCPGVAIHRTNLETYVEEVFLAVLGDVLVTEEETIEGASAELLEVEEALDLVAAKLRDVDDEDMEGLLLTQRRALVAKRKELRALPVEPKVQIIETGETYGELWRRQDLDGRRSLLASVLDEVRVLKGRRGGAPSMRQPVRDRAGLVWKGMARAS